MKHTCETYHRCNRCLKLNAKLRAKYYQRYREYLWKETDRDDLGRMILTPGQVNTLMHKRLAVGRATRRWKRGQAEEVAKQLKKAQFRVGLLEDTVRILRIALQGTMEASDIFEVNSAKCVDEYEKRLALQTEVVKLVGLFNTHAPEWSDLGKQDGPVDMEFHLTMKALEKLVMPVDDRQGPPNLDKSLEKA